MLGKGTCYIQLQLYRVYIQLHRVHLVVVRQVKRFRTLMERLLGPSELEHEAGLARALAPHVVCPGAVQDKKLPAGANDSH